jgi:F-type H+-transporting ATPase subunit delta
VDQNFGHDTVFDTGAEHLGRVYAEALLGAAQRIGVADLVVDQLGQLTGTLREHPNLAAAFASPRVDASEKKRVIDKLLAGTLDPTLVRFLKVVADRGRLGFLRDIAKSAKYLRDEALGRVVAEVHSAVPLDDNLRAIIAERLSQSLGRSVVLREKVDAQLIGGLLIRVGDTVFDASVAGRFVSMSKKTRQAFARQMLENAARFADSAS